MRKGSVGLIGLVLVAACGSSAPTPPPTPVPTHLPSPAASASAPASASPSASSLPADALPAPDGSDGEQVLLHNASGDYDVYKGIGRLDGLGSSCTFVLLATASDEAADTAPAYILSNGHCVGLFDPSTVIVDQAAPEGMATFNFFADATDREAVPTAKIAWATMKGVDLALIQLGATLGELIRLGYRPWPIDAPPAQSTPLVIVGAPVGVPIVDIPESERFLRAGTCDAGAGDLRVNERQWLWTGMTENACPEILPGNSGSPVLDRARGTLVGLINTTTFGASPTAAPCWLGTPCVVDQGGEALSENANYSVPVDGLAACFDETGAFVLGLCGLDTGANVRLANAPLAVNPAADDPITGKPARTTWATTVAAPDGAAGAWSYAYKIGPVGTTVCADPTGYSDPRSIAASPTINDKLPADEQRLLLCVVGGPSATPDSTWQRDRDASIAVAYIDTTAPNAVVRFSVGGDAATGWLIEPIFDPPTYSAFIIKGGPAATTSCADPAGYAPYRRNAIRVEASAAPYRFCAVGFDDANNRGPVAEQVLQ